MNPPKYLKLVLLLIVVTLAFIFNLNKVLFSSRLDNYLYGDEDLSSDTLHTPQLPPWASLQIIQQFNQNDNDSDEWASCKIPKLQPFHPSILQQVGEVLPPLICENDEHPLLFNSSLEPSPRLIPVKSRKAMEKLGIISCCIRKLSRVERNDDKSSLSAECRPLSLEGETEVPTGWEFVAVECQFPCGFWCKVWNALVRRGRTGRPVKVDFHTFFHNNPSPPNDLEGSVPRNGNESKPVLNVMILGFDAMSRMSFLRSMPEVYWFLMKNLSAVEMQGFHKIGENTFPNIGQMLTNTQAVEWGSRGRTILTCAKYFTLDKCPFIWKDYKAAGYRTLFAEDGVSMAIFNLAEVSFVQPPTDHYFRPFALAVQKYTAHERRSLSEMCYGPRPAFTVMMDYVEKMAVSMTRNATPFFQFAMTGAVTHEFLNGGRLLVTDLMASLQRLYQQGIFNNTVLIMMSDHGSRLDTIRSYPQGFLEDRYPFLYIAMPPWFRKQYSSEFFRLGENSKRLTTAWDVHETLKHILDLDNKLRKRKIRSTKEDEFFPPGISLFRPIPLIRTCDTAGIPNKFCSCNMHMTSVSINGSIVTSGAKQAVEYVNNLLVDAGVLWSCSKVTLNRILHAEQLNITFPDSKTKEASQQMLRINFETNPGAANFEALVQIKTTKTGISNSIGTVGRLDLFKEQSRCVNDKKIKPYCYCLQ